MKKSWRFWYFLSFVYIFVTALVILPAKADNYAGITHPALTYGVGGSGVTWEERHDKWYIGADLIQIDDWQPFLRVGKYLFKGEMLGLKTNLKFGACVTKATKHVSSVLMFNTSLELNKGIYSLSWSHCSNAGFRLPNQGYDILMLSMKV